MTEPLLTKLTLTARPIAETEDEGPPRVDDRGEPVPPGQLLADLVAGGLAGLGWKVEYRWTTFDAHAMDAQRKDSRYDIEVALTDRESGAYAVTAKPRVGFFKRVFASKVDASEHTLLRLDIDRVLAADPRVSAGAWAAGA